MKKCETLPKFKCFYLCITVENCWTLFYFMALPTSVNPSLLWNEQVDFSKLSFAMLLLIAFLQTPLFVPESPEIGYGLSPQV